VLLLPHTNCRFEAAAEAGAPQGEFGEFKDAVSFLKRGYLKG
jgi:hypothetical protein